MKDSTIKEKYLCPVCESFYFERQGDYDICPVCNWENDPVQERDPEFEGGANLLSLSQAREAYREKRTDDEEV